MAELSAGALLRRAQVIDLYGVRVCSEIDLGLGSVDPGPGVVDVELRVGTCRSIPETAPAGSVIAERLDGPRQPFYTATTSDEGYCLRFHRRFDFRMSPDRRSVRVDWHPGTELLLAAVYFTGTVMAFLLGLAGRLTLHASAVTMPAGSTVPGAFAIFGDSGVGKTTLAALCAAAGASFVTDDLLLVDLDGPDPLVDGTGNEFRLRPEAAWVLDRFREPPELRRTADGRIAVRPQMDEAGTGATQLRALVKPILVPDGDPVTLTPLSSVDALFELARAPRLAGWTAEHVVRRQFDAMVDLTRRVPSFVAHIPWDPGARLGVGAALLRLVGHVTG